MRGFLLVRCLMIVALCLTACSEPSPEELASLAAEGFYRHLVAGEYEKFLEGKAGSDSLPADYREQLLVGYKQFMAQQQATHQGIRGIQTTNARPDSTLQLMQVFLLVEYGDSTQEEIVVPMVEHDGRWRMK